jgi:hypothetical protein
MSDQKRPAPELDPRSMFALGGGRIGQQLERMQAARGSRLSVGRLAVLSVAVTWLPLLVLGVIEGVAWGDMVRVPFLKDFLPYGQFLIAAPLLILGQVALGRRLGLAALELRQSDVLAPEDTPVLDALLVRAMGLWRGRGVDIGILLLTLTATVLSFWGTREYLTGAWQYDGTRVTMPGWWFLLVSQSVIRFLILQWVWRLVLWAWVLWRTSRLRLLPQPVHPDRAGGLAFLGGTQVAFGTLVFAFGVQLSCVTADAVRYHCADLMEYKGYVIAFVLVTITVLLAPLLVFAPKLARAREECLMFLTRSGYRAAHYLDRQLRASKEGALPTDDVSGLTDFGPLYENARLMRPVPMEWRHVTYLLLSAALPFVPLVFLVMPAKEVFETLVKLVV